MTAEDLAGSLGLDEDTVLEAIRTLKTDYDGDENHRQRGFEIRHVAGGFRIFSRGDYHEVVKDFLTAGQSAKLSQAALETLAVIAYRQPISRPRIAAIRGVSVDGVIRTLLLRGLIVEAGKEASTSALLYATTRTFLDTMGMNAIDDLPDIAPTCPKTPMSPNSVQRTPRCSPRSTAPSTTISTMIPIRPLRCHESPIDVRE